MKKRIPIKYAIVTVLVFVLTLNLVAISPFADEIVLDFNTGTFMYEDKFGVTHEVFYRYDSNSSAMKGIQPNSGNVEIRHGGQVIGTVFNFHPSQAQYIEVEVLFDDYSIDVKWQSSGFYGYYTITEAGVYYFPRIYNNNLNDIWIIGTVELTEPTTEPSESTTNPAEPTTDPTEPTTDPTEPTTDPTKPTTDPTEPTTDSTEPTTDSTEPTTDPTEPTTDPTEPTTDPTEPTTDPTEPTEPTELIEPDNPGRPDSRPPRPTAPGLTLLSDAGIEGEYLEFEAPPTPLAPAPSEELGREDLPAAHDELEVEPEEEQLIFEENLPLSNMPQAGLNDMLAFWSIGICSSALVAVALLDFIRRKRKESHE